MKTWLAQGSRRDVVAFAVKVVFTKRRDTGQRKRVSLALRHLGWPKCRKVLSARTVGPGAKGSAFLARRQQRRREKRDGYLAQLGQVKPREELATPTVAEYIKRFLEYAETHTRATTTRSYEQVLRLHVVPYIGQLRLTDLSPDLIESMYEQL